jgi:phenylacetic acid degradation operon negative regulatory protein
MILSLAWPMNSASVTESPRHGHQTAGRRRVRPEGIARRFWPLAEIGEQWAEFVRDYRPTVDLLPISGVIVARPVGVATRNSDRLRCVVSNMYAPDPLLPPELLPSHWPGVIGRRLLVEAKEAIGTLQARTRIPALFGQFDDVIARQAQQ